MGETDFRFCNFVGRAGFVGTRFEGPARFDRARFEGQVVFDDTRFVGLAGFRGTRFKGPAVFDGAQFAEEVVFSRARFAEQVVFNRARFGGRAGFNGACFERMASFSGARFEEPAEFEGARFKGLAGFHDTWFEGLAKFSGARFKGPAVFDGARFKGLAVFDGTQFVGDAAFDGARFVGKALFSGARFEGLAGFNNTWFEGPAKFNNTWFEGRLALFDGTQFEHQAIFTSVQFKRPASFVGARFAVENHLGPLVTDRLDMTRAFFAKRVVVEIETGVLLAPDARFEEGVELRIRYARVDLRRVFFGGPSSLSGVAESFADTDGVPVVATQQMITGWAVSTRAKPAADRGGARLEPWVPSLVSVQETDVSQLTVADVDLGCCRFAGAHQLDKLRLEGRSPFSRPPRGWRAGWAWLPVWRWSARRVLAEEHPWRAGRRKSGGWHAEVPHLDDEDAAAARLVAPERLAVLYRSLRKAAEDAKNEAGAGDFYYGEMEARRHASTTSRGERAVLSFYWMISGYGQRAGRTLAALVLLIGVLFGSLTQFGLPVSTAVQQMTATVPAATAGRDQQITVDVKPVSPGLPPQEQRWTADRMDKAIGIALGSVVFRDSGVPLTRAGTWTVMAGRALGPVLLALAALAIRARVKR